MLIFDWIDHLLYFMAELGLPVIYLTQHLV